MSSEPHIHSQNKRESKLDLSNYPAKSDLRNAKVLMRKILLKTLIWLA